MKRIMVFILVAVFMLLVGCSAVDTATKTTATETSEKDEPVNVYEDENIRVDFIKIANSILDGNFELYMKTQNKTDKKVTVYLQDVSLNGAVVQVGSGVPCEMIAGANRTHSWFGRLDLAGVNSADDIKTITFKVRMVDEEFNTIITTTDLEVTIPHS